MSVTTAFANSFGGLPVPSLRRPRRAQCAINGVVCAAESRIQEGSSNGNGPSPDDQWTTGRVRAARRQRGGGRSRRGSVRIQGKYYRPRALPPQPPGLHVTAGTARGRRVMSPNVYLRPMMSKVREALFSMLEMFEVLRSDGAALDLFAGSGSVGIEALSRGMGRAVFVDSAMECTDTINGNLVNCGFGERGQSVCARVEDFVQNGITYNNQRHYDLITITPPYEEVDYAELMTSVATSDCVGENTFVVVEYPVELRTLPPSISQRLIGIRNRRYGRTVLALYACQPDIDITPRPDEFMDKKRRR